MKYDTPFWIVSGIALFFIVIVLAVGSYTLGHQNAKSQAVRECIELRRKY